MAWLLDAPSGVYKDHALSSKIREAAVADSQFMRFVQAEPGYGKGRGQSVSITRVFPLSLATRVGELDRLPSGRPAIDTIQITASEWGFKIPMTQFEKNLTHFDLTNQFQRVLRDQMRLTMDGMVAEAMKTSVYKFTPDVSGGAFGTGGVAPGTADANLAVADLRRIHDELAGVLKAPKFRNGKYIGILSTKGARGIKNDPEYKDWLRTNTIKPFVTGMLPAEVENFILVETNHFDALSNGIGTGSVLGECVFFGADAAVLATVDEPELRAGLPEDLGRFRDVGWVGTLEAGLVWDIAANARLIHVTSL